jgi:hypothetical protein
MVYGCTSECDVTHFQGFLIRRTDRNGHTTATKFEKSMNPSVAATLG